MFLKQNVTYSINLTLTKIFLKLDAEVELHVRFNTNPKKLCMVKNKLDAHALPLNIDCLNFKFFIKRKI